MQQCKNVVIANYETYALDVTTLLDEPIPAPNGSTVPAFVAKTQILVDNVLKTRIDISINYVIIS